MASSLGSKDPIQASFLDHFSCKICLEILKKPVQCQRNEHYFCTSCITRHLTRRQTCPLCMEELTLKTLRPIPRVVADILSQYDAPLCKYVQRGCQVVLKLQQDLPVHHQVCGFAPVSCSNEGCHETVNKQDRENHEKESCMFRKIKCEVCDEDMTYRDHVKHPCVLREDLDEMKLLLAQSRTMLTEFGGCLKEIRDEVKGHGEAIKNLQDPLRSASSTLIRQERRNIINGQIVVAGGHDSATMKSYEVFNWSTKSWTLFENALFFEHRYSFSFPHNNNIMICGGETSKRVECLDVANARVFASPVIFPGPGKGALYARDEIISFEKSVVITHLKAPHLSKTAVSYEKGKSRQHYGVECVNKKVLAVGGSCSELVVNQFYQNQSTVTDDVLCYNPATNELKKLAPLLKKVSHMATVPYEDNIIIMGGKRNREISNSVMMYNVTREEYEMLPNMMEARYGCTAVIMGDVIVVMGGCSGKDHLNTVEYHVLGQATWNELPPMNCCRLGATACVHV